MHDPEHDNSVPDSAPAPAPDAAGDAPPESGHAHGPPEGAQVNSQAQECTFHITLPADAESDDERRVAGRFPVERVICDVGRVLDLSRTGVRLERRGRLPSGRPVQAALSDGELAVTIACEVRWERKLGFMKWEYGLQFLDISEDDARIVARIASNCREQRKLLRRGA